MRRRLAALAVGAALALAGATGPAAAASTPIGPHQHFVALVNGKRAGAVVKVVCSGPVASGRQGRVIAGQRVAVLRRGSGPGDTGAFTDVHVWVVPPKPQPAPVQVRLTRYGRPVAIPTSIRVPCSGTGTVQFSSCPYLAPCAFGWVPVSVPVRFVDIGAK